MEEFLKDRQLEKETYAIVNFFKLLRQAEVSEIETYNYKYFPNETFALIGGVNSYNRLLSDCKEGNIDVCSNSISCLFETLTNNINYINSTPFSKSIITKQAIEDFELIKKFYSEVYSVNGNLNTPAIYDLATLPLPDDMINEFRKLKEKKLG